MIRRSVSYAPEALDDLSSLYDWIEGRTSPETAFSYMARLLAHLESFDLGAERGTRRDDIRPGLRIVGFERRVTIAFAVDETRVLILRLFYGGANWIEVI
ncbi:MAG: plasmid stabilization protein [Phenylobacterium sp. SCN 69-14]|nr:MAG: plasmid stabilization protein [Phenylobacterium sp. SCN 69-14]